MSARWCSVCGREHEHTTAGCPPYTPSDSSETWRMNVKGNVIAVLTPETLEQIRKVVADELVKALWGLSKP